MNEVSRTQKTYNALAKLWDKSSKDSFFHEKQFRFFNNLLKKGDSVADIGCATGLHVPLFLGLGNRLKYEGFDFSESMLKIARSRYPNLKFNLLDVTKKKTFPKKKFNAFWASAVLMHVPQKDWESMFSNLESIIKPGGYGYITMPEEKPHTRSSYDERHFTIISGKDFEKYIKTRDWKIIKRGAMLGHNDIPWNWFIVKLP